MRSHDSEIDSVGPTPDPQKLRQDDRAGLAAKVLADGKTAGGRTAALDHHAVVHLQASAGNASVSRLLSDEEGPSKVKSVIGSGGGERLDPTTAQRMGERFGEDFSDVRIHRDAQAHESARAVNAHAYTVGSNIVFQSGRYDPGSESGQRTLAHELTHVVQQRSGPVAGTAVGGGIKVSHPADAYEQAATRSADRIMAMPASQPSTPVAAPSVQREAAAPEDAVQRQAAPEEEEEQAAGEVAQRQEEEQEEEGAGQVAQRQAEEEEEQAAGMMAQREGEEEEEQGAAQVAQRQAAPEEEEEQAPA